MANNLNQTTAIAVKDEDVVKKITAWSGDFLSRFYRGKNFELWKEDAVLAIVQNEKLRKCLNNEIDALKLVRALQLNATSGLSLNPQLRQAALAVYDGNKGLSVTHIPMKDGLIKKAMETRKVAKIESGTVYENDKFTIKKSSRGDEYEWLPALCDRGKPVAYYACVTLNDNTTIVEYQTYQQVWDWAIKYGQGKEWDNEKEAYKDKFKYDSAWGKSFDGMAEKTVIRAVLNGLHLPEIEELFVDEDRAADEMRDVTEPPPEKGTGADDLAADLAERETDQAQEVAQSKPVTETAETPRRGAPDDELDIF